MIESLNILRTASAMARHGAERHALIARNVANADTPGYKARDLASFTIPEDSFDDAPFVPATARSGHFSASSVETAFETQLSSNPEAASPNGNTVSLEDQMVRAAAAQGEHETAMAIYSKSLDILRLGLGRLR